jgi:hypothetical protein
MSEFSKPELCSEITRADDVYFPKIIDLGLQIRNLPKDPALNIQALFNENPEFMNDACDAWEKGK